VHTCTLKDEFKHNLLEFFWLIGMRFIWIGVVKSATEMPGEENTIKAGVSAVEVLLGSNNEHT
jgi:hypothetical protein